MRHRWNSSLPHVAKCSRCGLVRRQVFFGSGRGSSTYYVEAAGHELYVARKAPLCPYVPDPVDVQKRLDEARQMTPPSA